MLQLGRKIRVSDIKYDSGTKRWSDIIELIFRIYAPENRADDFIFGDKTPGYVRHMPLLKTLFPSARFIHIIRDPRDYSLSVIKVWGKSMRRAATRWLSTIEQARIDGAEIGADYLEIYYEDLLSETETTIKDVCKFLEIEFIPAMTRLSRPSENLGDTTGIKTIVKLNQKKYASELSPEQIRRIEEIVFPARNLLKYQFLYASKYKPLSQSVNSVLKFYDGWASLRHHVQVRGFKDGIRVFYNHHRYSSWR